MWPFNRKPKPEPVDHPPLTEMVEQADAARNERSDTVAAFVQKMRDLRFQVEIEPDLRRRRDDQGHGAAD